MIIRKFVTGKTIIKKRFENDDIKFLSRFYVQIEIRKEDGYEKKIFLSLHKL